MHSSQSSIQDVEARDDQQQQHQEGLSTGLDRDFLKLFAWGEGDGDDGDDGEEGSGNEQESESESEGNGDNIDGGDRNSGTSTSP